MTTSPSSSSAMATAAIPVRVAADTDSGLVRQHNEDAFLINTELGLFAVADGVGGHVGGVEASRLVVSELPVFFKESLSRSTAGAGASASAGVAVDAPVDADANADVFTGEGAGELAGASTVQIATSSANNSTVLNETFADTDLQRRLYGAIRKVNTCVFEAGADKVDDGRMGATLTGALFLSSGTTLIFNVGDSRTYCYRNKELVCVTKDQSWYQSWLDNGSVGAPPPKSVILQGVGLDETVVPDWTMKPWQANDLWLMCSDGLSDRVSCEDITRMIETHLETDSSLVALCGELITAANQAGGEDNITVLALRPNSTTS